MQARVPWYTCGGHRTADISPHLQPCLKWSLLVIAAYPRTAGPHQSQDALALTTQLPMGAPGITDTHAMCLTFWEVRENPNSGPPACVTSTLPIQPPPQAPYTTILPSVFLPFGLGLTKMLPDS